MKVGIIGSRGIPNQYGGFEQFAQYLAVGLVERGHEVSVYNSSLHPYEDDHYQGVQIIHGYEPEWMGTAGQFIYDRNCLIDSRKRGFDILLHLGYTSDSLFHRHWAPSMIHMVNMDGMEWKRSKYNWLTRKFLEKAESMAVRHADHLIADSTGIQTYLHKKYNAKAIHIPYGAFPFLRPDSNRLSTFHVEPFSYSLLIARMEPENNIETIIRGYLLAGSRSPLLVIGNAGNHFGERMVNRYNHPSIRFLGGIYDLELLDNLRFHGQYYFHGHTVGGTNPSLLEAMASQANIVAHDNIFNRSVLEEDAAYFTTAEELAETLVNGLPEEWVKKNKANNLRKIETHYNWNKIIDEYETAMQQALIKA